MTVVDRWGNAVRTDSEEAARLLEQATTEFVLFRDDPAATLDAAVEADPDAPLPHIVRAEFDLFAQTRDGLRSAREQLAVVDTLPDVGAPRERLHAAAAHAWADGHLGVAARHLDRAVALDPHDLLALRVAHDLSFFTGDSRNIRDVVARARHAWAEPDPLFGAVQGMYAFGLEENGEYHRAEEAARYALWADGSDVWATHALAHVFEMEARTDEGVAFLEESAVRWDASFFAVHNWWHLALYRIAQDRSDLALSLFDGPVRARHSELWLDLADAASLLWRLSLVGVDIGDRAAALVPAVEPKSGDGLSAFNDLHAVMVFGLAGRHDLVDAVLGGASGTEGTTYARALALSGTGLLHGFRAFARGDATEAVDHLLVARGHSALIGGSVAQRDVIDQTLLAAAARAGDDGLVRSLVSERVERTPAAAGPAERLVEVNRS